MAITIIKDEKLKKECLEDWDMSDFPIDELNWILDNHDGETFVLGKDEFGENRLFEVITNSVCDGCKYYDYCGDPERKCECKGKVVSL